MPNARSTPLFMIFLCLIVFGDVLGRGIAAAAEGETTPGAAMKKDKSSDVGTGCADLPDTLKLKRLLREAPGTGEAGGLGGGRFQWAAVVDRNGTLCALAVSTDDAAAAWPGSRAIAMAKAFTANAFSSDTTPLSTARLYTLSLPGHSLWGAGAGNPLNAACLSTPDTTTGIGKVCGGTIVFGGGVALYRGKTRVGGLGTSGDTSCTDHEIAKRMRHAAGLDPEKGEFVDDITYAKADGATIYSHPLCPNTWRNGKKIGEEGAQVPAN
jgi:uncharacterized protein GlcG (DUF336 family)